MRPKTFNKVKYMQGILYEIGKNLYGTLTPYEQVIIDPSSTVAHNGESEGENHTGE